jgi:hypothetical protein
MIYQLFNTNSNDLPKFLFDYSIRTVMGRFTATSNCVTKIAYIGTSVKKKFNYCRRPFDAANWHERSLLFAAASLKTIVVDLIRRSFVVIASVHILQGQARVA